MTNKITKTGADAIRAGLEDAINGDEITYYLDIRDLLSNGLEILGFNGLYLKINQNEECFCKSEDIAPCNDSCTKCELVNLEDSNNDN